MESDGMERDMFGSIFELFSCCQLVSVTGCYCSFRQVAVILDPSAVEPSESLGLMKGYGKNLERYLQYHETSDEFAS